MSSIVKADDLDLSAIRLFLTVVELGSVSKAAARLRVAQPSATAKLHKLERQLGLALIDRSPTGSTPTEAGTRLAPRCQATLDVAAELLASAAAQRQQSNRLSIATTRHIAEHYLVGWAARIAGQPVNVVHGDTLQVARSVRQGDTAVGFVEGPGAPIGLRSSLLVSEPIVAVVGSEHSWFTRRAAVSGRHLATALRILPPAGSGLRDVVESTLAGYRDPESTSTSLVVSAPDTRSGLVHAATGDGIAFVPRCVAEPYLATGAVRELSVAGIELALPIRAVWRGTQPAQRSARRLLAEIAADG